MTKRAITDESFIQSVDRIHNANLRIVSSSNIGTYRLASNAENFGAGDPRGIYNWDTNKWDYRGEIIGDMDGIIDIYDENGILLANCTVNGDAEYFGRYNYTVRIDGSGDMYLDVGWNNREGRVYAADGYDNLTLATAAALPENGTKLTIDSASDADWFRFTMQTPGRSSSFIGIDFKQWAGDLDLYLYDAAGNQLDYAKSVTDDERISLKGLAAGDYYVKVVGYEGNVNEYKLAFSLPESVVLTDEYEKGNSPLFNTYVGEIAGTKTVGAAIQTANDVDYFSFLLSHKGTTADSMTLTFAPEFGDLDLYLYDASGIFLLGKSISADSGSETISFKGLLSGLYVAKVVSKDGITVANYDLTFNVREKEVKPDKYENNNTRKRATNLYTLNGEKTLSGLTVHSDTDVDFYKFSILEKGSSDDWITLSCEVSLGDLDLEILNSSGDVVAYSRTAENDDTVSLKGLDVGEYYIRVYGYNNVANNYMLSWNVTNSSLIPSDSYEGMEPVAIRENQTVSGLSVAKPVKNDETRTDTFKITLDYTGWKRSRIILTDYRSDWEDGMAYVLKDSDGNELQHGTGSEISLAGLAAGDYFLTVDAPNEDEYSEYSLIAQCLPDSDNAKDNTWSFFIYMAGDNNLEGAALQELLYMQKAVLPENVEVYVLLDRNTEGSTAQRDWTDTRVGRIRHSLGGAVAVEWMYFDGVNTNTYMNTQNLDLKKEWDTGSINTLEAFLDWGMQTGRADNYALILYDHGSSLGYNCQDDESSSIMSVEEIAGLLQEDKYKDLSVVAFDQCLMGSDVVISTMEGTVDYVVASEAIGYTPNLLVMYKVLLNSLETEMTPQEVSQKIVAACNCSGLVNLTMASFHTADHTLSEALQAFGEAAKGFTRQDWVAICKSFALSHNYGDEHWAYSDLGAFLGMLKEYSTSISGTLMEATETLYDVVLNQLLDSTMITPTIYGSGLAVFNPVLSNDVISFYATGIGQTAWGDFLYTAGQLAEDCSEYFVDNGTNLTFTDFSYSFEGEEMQVTYNLGAFYGNGAEYRGLYMDNKARYTISLDKAGVDGDAIVVTADNPEANITVSLVETLLTFPPSRAVRKYSTDGILSLAGVDPTSAVAASQYDLIITSDRETTYSLSFVADWSSGSDFFDYSRSGSLGGQGNGSIEKATKLAAGNYGGLVTYVGDPDFYQLNTVYSDTLSVTVNGTGLTVQEYDSGGLFVQGAEYADGKYTIIVANGNYLRVEGNADLAAKEVNSYSLYISDVSSTYLSLGGTEIQLPGRPVVSGELQGNQVTVTVNVEDGMKGYQSGDLQNWTLCKDDMFVAEDNGLYYFKSVDPETKLESKYTSLRVVGIDNVLPTVSNVKADVITPTNGNVIVTAEFADDVQLDVAQYRIDEGGKWLDYVDGVTVSENATVYFRAIDVAGNTSAIVPYDVTNIDKALPTVSNVQADITDPTKGSVTVTAVFADNIELKQSLYKLGEGGIWSDYVDGVIVTDNTTVYFKAVDTAGNEAEEAYAVGNIDRDTPVIVVSGDNTTPLKASSLTVTTEAGLDILYSTDGESWTKYEGEITVMANDTYYFMATDAAGNTGRAEYEFRNIDTTPPEKPIASADITTPTKGNVTITATFSADSITKEYSLDGQNWQEYTKSIELSQNGSVYFRGADEAGNISECETYMVNNIDRTPPDKPVATADITEPTNSDVLVSATFSEDSMTKEYSLNGQDWKPYTAPILFLQNGEVYFQGTDAAGNTSSIETYTVSNIDKVAPDKPVATADITVPTNGKVHVSAIFNGKSVKKEYSLNKNDWFDYEGSVEFSDNGTVFFRSTDALGNVSEVTPYEVTNIDNVAPEKPTAIPDIIAPTNQSVTVTASFSGDSEKKEYRIGEGEWTAYTGPVTMTQNGIVSFRGTDEAGNLSEVAEYEIMNIDKVVPTISNVKADITVPTNQAVTVTATFADNVELKQSLYKFGETGDWLDYDYENGVVMKENMTVYFKAVDLAGNKSEITSYEVKNIDKAAPVITLSGDNTTPLQASTLTASTEDGLDIFYSTDNQTWTKYTGEIAVSANATYYFKATDAAGNIGTAEFTFTNIDTIAPEAPIVSADITDATNQNVTVTAVFSDDSAEKEYSLDGTTWLAYTVPIIFEENGNVSFRSMDAAGNISATTSCTVGNIDKIAPDKPTASADVTAPTNTDVLVSAVFSADSVVKEYSLDGQIWKTYDEAVVFTENGSVMFRGTDEAGNVSAETKYEVTNIDKTVPVIDLVSDCTTPLQASTLTATTEAGLDIYWSTDNETWTRYDIPLNIASNGTYFFKTTDPANNTGTASIVFFNIDTDAPVITLTGDNQTPLQQTTLTATVDDGSPIYYRIGDTGEWLEYKEPITVTDNATYNFLATDTAGNEGTDSITFANIIQAPISDVVPQTQTWEKVEEATQYIVEYSTDNFEHVIQLVVDSNSLDSFQMPAGNYQMRVKPEDGEWTVLDPIVASEANKEPKLVKSNTDGNADVFFANPIGTWESGYVAQHVGSINDWSGTNEYASVCGKNKLADIIEGSTDANILLMTDDDNGDSLFVDDIYTVLPGSVSEQQSRIARIDEIRAGAGDDIVDMTSQQFEYIGDGLTIRGGAGNDTIWANKGDNKLFGDAGNDRIVGASGEDVIVGGIGNDHMHGGGGNDIFTFGENWGTDTVEQLVSGSVMLWFASGDESKWNAATLTYTDGANSVKVSGIKADKITLKFGDDDSDQFAALSSVCAFADFTSQRLFEESGKGILASL